MDDITMGNLGGYQILAIAAKRVGGPEKFVVLLVGGGALIGGVVTIGAGAIKRKVSVICAEKHRKAEATVIYTVHTEGKSNEGLLFKVGDKFKVLESDEDAGLIEKIDDDDNPYFVSLHFLGNISDYGQA